MNTPSEHSRVTKPNGGYVLLQAGQILNAWAAHREAIITLADLRVWLACHELVARRLRAPIGCCTTDRLAELACLIGVRSPCRVRTSLGRLVRAGLMQWNGAGISFTRVAKGESVGAIPSPMRLVPIPRPLLKHLARGVSRGTLATTLGLLLRCVFYYRGRCTNQGMCKASWVAEVFGIDERSVKRARAHLLSLGWIQSLPTVQWRLNRWGGVFCVDLDWAPATRRPLRVSPPRADLVRRLSPPESDKHPLREYNNQKPASGAPTGVRGGLKGITSPSLHNIRPEDLRRRDRLLALHDQACRRGLAEAGEAGRLRFASLAARARRVATRNEGGMFAWLLRERRWNSITLEDEDRARVWLATSKRERTGRMNDGPRCALLSIGSIVPAVLHENMPFERAA